MASYLLGAVAPQSAQPTDSPSGQQSAAFAAALDKAGANGSVQPTPSGVPPEPANSNTPSPTPSPEPGPSPTPPATASATPSAGAPPPGASNYAAGTTARPLDRVFADIAHDAYNDTSTGSIDGWHRLNDQQLTQLGLNPADFNDDKSNFHSYLYTNGDGHYALAFRGTEPSSAKDWLTNAGQGLGFNTKQYDEAEQVGREVAMDPAVGQDNVAMVGHSKGGGEADAAAIASGTVAVTFNGAGLSNNTIERMGFDPATAKSDLQQTSRNYSVDGDILTWLQTRPLVHPPAALGTQIALQNPDPNRTAPGDTRVPFSSDSFWNRAFDPLYPAAKVADDVKHGIWSHSAYQEAMDRLFPNA